MNKGVSLFCEEIGSGGAGGTGSSGVPVKAATLRARRARGQDRMTQIFSATKTFCDGLWGYVLFTFSLDVCFTCVEHI